MVETPVSGTPGADTLGGAAPILEARGLHAAYGQVRVLHGMDFIVNTGGVTTLLGANGAGKTTTLRAICGMVRSTGDLLFEGKRINNLPTEAIAAMRVGHVPDGRGTFMELTVEENLRLGGYTRRDSIEPDIERMFTYFPKLKDRSRQQAGTLSGGEQQMLAIARALATNPKLLLLDEPLEGLAPIIVDELLAALRRIVREEKMTAIIVEQSARKVLPLTDNAIILERGQIAWSGVSADLAQDHETISKLLGVAEKTVA